jgi:zinc/manganese transport system substrate-binding protein
MLMLAAPAAAQEKVKAVASFSIIGDLVKQVGGDMLDLTILVGPDSDAHVYSPSPADAKAVADARIMFVNGLGFEGWIPRLVKASGTKGAVVIASQGIKARRADDGRQHGHAHGHSESDPHAWQSVANAKIYVANIRHGLMRVDPANRTAYEANAARYLAQLEALEREIADEVARIPAERRRIFTSHDAFGYFKAAYGIDFIAPQGVSTESEASAQDVARIITQIKRQKIPAVFLENVTDSRMIKRIAAETGARIGGTLYSDALTDEKGVAPTYIDMIRHNLRTLSAALSS